MGTPHDGPGDAEPNWESVAGLEFANLLIAVSEHRREQLEKHGTRSCHSPFISPETKLVILVEEVGEVARAMTYDEGDRAELKEELIQVATVALGMASSL